MAYESSVDPSGIDETKPEAVRAYTADMRANFAAIKEALTYARAEIEAGRLALAIELADVGAYYATDNVEAALQELGPLLISAGYFDYTRHAISPNDTRPAHKMQAAGAESSLDIVLAPKGIGAIITAVPDDTSTGGNKRGVYAVDLQLRRVSADQVASGNYSFLAGKWNSSGGDSSFCMGAGNDIFGDVSVGFGASADDRGINFRYTFGGGNFVVIGDCQYAVLPVSAETTTATTRVLTAYDQTLAVDNVAILPDDHTYAVTADIVARDTATGDSAHWQIQGTAKRGTGVAATAIVGTPAISTIAMDTGALAWVVSLIADTTNGAVEVQVTGEAGKTIHWLSKFNTIEVG